MSALDRNPINPNFLQPNKFQLNFARLPNIQFFCQTVNIPGISLNEAIRTTPFVDLYSPGEKAIYETLSVTFIVDEELVGWKEVHDWIRAMTFPVSYSEYANLPNLNANARLKSNKFPQFSDASITILTSANNPFYKFKFYDCFPTSLSSFVLSSTDSPDNTITADATFRYNYYDIEKLG